MRWLPQRSAFRIDAAPALAGNVREHDHVASSISCR